MRKCQLFFYVEPIFHIFISHFGSIRDRKPTKSLRKKSSSMFKRLAGIFKSDNPPTPSHTTFTTPQEPSPGTPVDSDLSNANVGNKSECVLPRRQTTYEEDALLPNLHSIREPLTTAPRLGRCSEKSHTITPIKLERLAILGSLSGQSEEQQAGEPTKKSCIARSQSSLTLAQYQPVVFSRVYDLNAVAMNPISDTEPTSPTPSGRQPYPPELIAELSVDLESPAPSFEPATSISRTASHTSLLGCLHESPPCLSYSPHIVPGTSSLHIYFPRKPPVSDCPGFPHSPRPSTPSQFTCLSSVRTSLEDRGTPLTPRSPVTPVSLHVLSQFPTTSTLLAPKAVNQGFAGSLQNPSKLTIKTGDLMDQSSPATPRTNLTAFIDSALSSPVRPSSEEGTILGHSTAEDVTYSRVAEVVGTPLSSSHPRSKGRPASLTPILQPKQHKIVLTKDNEGIPYSPPAAGLYDRSFIRHPSPLDFENLLIPADDFTESLTESLASSAPPSPPPSPLPPSRCSSPDLVPDPPALGSSRMSSRMLCTPKTERSEPSPKLIPLRDPFKDLRWRMNVDQDEPDDIFNLEGMHLLLSVLSYESQ